MKIWCTPEEKKQLIRILAHEDSLCVFNKFVCVKDDCNDCLEHSIDWHVVKRRNKDDKK